MLGVPKTSNDIQIMMKMPNPSQEPLVSSKDPRQDYKNMEVFCTFKINLESNLQVRCLSKLKDHIQIIIKMQNSN